MVNYFTFAGERSTDYGLSIERYPMIPLPARKVELRTVLGRNGSYISDHSGFDNVSITYPCYYKGDPAHATQIAAWLYAHKAEYMRLEDSYHPGVYRRAICLGPGEIQNVRNRFGRLTVNFTALPEQWLLDGDRPIVVEATGSSRVFGAHLLNPTKFPASPLIRLEGNGECALTIGSTVIEISDIFGYVDIDCATGEAYRGNVSHNAFVEISAIGWPTLGAGESSVTCACRESQTIKRMTIWPRWWTL